MMSIDAAFQLDPPRPMHDERFWIATIDDDKHMITKFE